MKAIGIFLVLVCFVAANTNPNAIQQTGITDQHVQNKHHDIKDISTETTEQHSAPKQQRIQPIQDNHKHREFKKLQPQNNSNTKQHHPSQVQLAVNVKHDNRKNKLTQNKNSFKHNKIVAKQHLAVKKHVEEYQVQQNYVNKQHHTAPIQQTVQDHHVNRKRHYAHRNMLLKSSSIRKLTDVDEEGFENEIVGMLKGIEIGKIK